MVMDTNSIFFIVLGIVSVCIISALAFCYLAFHNYNTNVSVETEKNKIEVSSHSNSNL